MRRSDVRRNSLGPPRRCLRTRMVAAIVTRGSRCLSGLRRTRCAAAPAAIGQVAVRRLAGGTTARSEVEERDQQWTDRARACWNWKIISSSCGAISAVLHSCGSVSTPTALAKPPGQTWPDGPRQSTTRCQRKQQLRSVRRARITASGSRRGASTLSTGACGLRSASYAHLILRWAIASRFWFVVAACLQHDVLAFSRRRGQRSRGACLLANVHRDS